MLLMLWQYPDVSPLAFGASFVFPAYYVGLSITLHLRASRQLDVS
jgi:hypothetical protein